MNGFGPTMKEDMQKFRRITGVYLGMMFVIVGIFMSAMLAGYDFIGYAFIAGGLSRTALFLMDILAKTRPKLARVLSDVLKLAIILFLLAFVITEALIVNGSHTDAAPEADYLIVLGAGVNGTEPSLALTDRLNAALDYLNEYPNADCIVTGCQGKGEDITEAESMYRWLIQSGIDGKRIIKEEEAVNTYENIKNSYAIIEGLGGDADKTALLTAEYHLYRAKHIAEELGFAPRGVAAETSLWPIKINYYIRECFGVWKNIVTGE
ncbi:MAG: YdcF family protein [Oscillospiraceae bacterium]